MATMTAFLFILLLLSWISFGLMIRMLQVEIESLRDENEELKRTYQVSVDEEMRRLRSIMEFEEGCG